MTSAAQLTLIIDELLASQWDKKLDRHEAFSLLESKGLLPAKLKPKPSKPSKPVSLFASQAAEDAAAEAELKIPEDFTGTSKDGKITVKDVKDLCKKNEVKVNASPAAKAFASANGLSIEDFTGSGPDGKVLMSDLKLLECCKKVKKASTSPKLTPKAKKLVEKWQLDEDDVKEVTGTGAGGSVKESDLKELIAAAKEAWEEEESEEDVEE